MMPLPLAKKPLRAALPMPGSKSLSHRALIAAALADGRSEIHNLLQCDDVSLTIGGLRALGVPIEVRRQKVLVSGNRGLFNPPDARRRIFLGNSGTSMRLLLSTAALAPGSSDLGGSARLHERPVGELVRALSQAGVQCRWLGREGYPPVRVFGKQFVGGKVQLSGAHSSQFLSSLLLAAPCAAQDLEISVSGPIVSRPYVDLTLEVMARFGICVRQQGEERFTVPAGQSYAACSFDVEGDLSSASYFWAAAAVAGGSVSTTNLRPLSSRQGDGGFLEVLEAMGCNVKLTESSVTVGGGGELQAVEADLSQMPDMVPTLAAAALFAGGKTRIRNVAHLRLKESDRLRAIALEWRKLGAHVDELPDGLGIEGGRNLAGTVLNPHDDHRLAMAAAVIALRTPGTALLNPGCVGKSFPSFWRLWEELASNR